MESQYITIIAISWCRVCLCLAAAVVVAAVVLVVALSRSRSRPPPEPCCQEIRIQADHDCLLVRCLLGKVSSS